MGPHISYSKIIKIKNGGAHMGPHMSFSLLDIFLPPAVSSAATSAPTTRKSIFVSGQNLFSRGGRTAADLTTVKSSISQAANGPQRKSNKNKKIAHARRRSTGAAASPAPPPTQEGRPVARRCSNRSRCRCPPRLSPAELEGGRVAQRRLTAPPPLRSAASSSASSAGS